MKRRARQMRRRARRAMLARRRRFTVHTHGAYETPAETRIVHEIPRD